MARVVVAGAEKASETAEEADRDSPAALLPTWESRGRAEIAASHNVAVDDGTAGFGSEGDSATTVVPAGSSGATVVNQLGVAAA